MDIQKDTIEKKPEIVYNSFTMSVTYQPKRKKRMTTHGFLVRMSTPGGRNIIRNRRRAG